MKYDPDELSDQPENGVELTLVKDDDKPVSSRQRAIIIGETFLKYLKPETYAKRNKKR